MRRSSVRDAVEGVRQHEKSAPSVESDSTRRNELTDRFTLPGAVLYRTDLKRLGYERRAVDAIFRELPVIALPGYSRPMVRATDFAALLEHATYDENKVRGR